MNKHIYKTLEFAKITTALKAHCASELGAKEASELAAFEQIEAVESALNETTDALNALRFRGIPVPKLKDLGMPLKRLEIGADLNAKELFEIMTTLVSVGELQRYFADLKERTVDFYVLYGLVDSLVNLPQVNNLLRTSIGENAQVLDEASDALFGIRHKIHSLESSIRDILSGWTRGKDARYLSDTLITMRNDRYVLPVKAEHRGVFGGIVHDQSASGSTLYIEPKNVVEKNNNLRGLRASEKQEIERILHVLSDEVREYIKEIRENSALLGHLDLINAKGLYAKALKANVPLISRDKKINLKQAFHPLLNTEHIVKNDIYLGDEFKTLIITGPNTGGKTLSIKTLGLLQLMGQAGLAIPAGIESQIGIFSEIFADIGDEQSIEQNLSTFSSHMTNIVEIAKLADSDSLILLDELGAGTDPEEGAALAIAILNSLSASYVMATTHYPELKVYGYNTAGVLNASMEFDVASLSPTYHLLIGVPGSSNAFEISKRLGLSVDVIDEAKGLIRHDSQTINEMIGELEKSRRRFDSDRSALEARLAEAEKHEKSLRHELKMAEENRERERAAAEDEARKIVENSRREAKALIDEIRKANKEHELNDLAGRANLLGSNLSRNKVLKKAKEAKRLKVGTEVMVTSYGQRGKIVDITKNDEYTIQMGALKMNIPMDEVEALAQPKKAKPKRAIATRVGSNGAGGFSPKLDLRGERYEDAIVLLDRYIADALLNNYPRVTIVHGKGTGAVRDAVTKYLRKSNRISSFEIAPQTEGGLGATIVNFE
ncbi:MAG: endonuclease MutS2 [Lactobacillales bacterium]|jgi:DNA mismatch repair protein MutS2|nr:endonuclease MutS2 [Lactobacillales bacterium]